MKHIFLCLALKMKILTIHEVVLFIYKQTDIRTDRRMDRSFADVYILD